MTLFLEQLYRFLWGVPMVVLLLGTGVYLSVLCGFPQIRFFTEAIRRFRPSFHHREDVSQFRALCTALAATVGTGNLIGVAGAICIGGPGAVFWMWVCGFWGMATKYAEAVLAVRYHVLLSGQRVGGTMYMIRDGLSHRSRFLASLYCIFGLTACFGVGNMIQANAITTALSGLLPLTFPGQKFLIGIILSLLIGCILSGGAVRIGSLAERIVPVAAGIYVIFALSLLVIRWRTIPDAFAKILNGAFHPKAVTAGAIGSAWRVVTVGCSRGMFTNEAGLGTASMAHGSAAVSHPVEQGMMGILEVFLDTIVICTLTALVILTGSERIPYGFDSGITVANRAFGSIGGVLVAVCLCCFAFATILGWGLYGLRCCNYLFPRAAWFPYCAAIVCFVGASVQTRMLWRIAEILNGLMAFPNLIALLLLSPELQHLTIQYTESFPFQNHIP